MEIQLTQGQTTIIDDSDYPKVSKYKWCANKLGGKFYAVSNSAGKTILMHRIVIDAPSMTEVDHINGNALDNRRSNLRLASHKENSQNRSFLKRNTSGYTGVFLEKKTNRWNAQIKIGYRHIHLGVFAEKEDAARAYDKAAKKHYGEFARLNFPD